MIDTIPNLVGHLITHPSTDARSQMPLPPIKASLFEYVLAGNGIFIRGARREFQTQFCIQPFVVRGLQELDLSLHMNGPHVSPEIVAEMLRLAREARDTKGHPCEIVFHLELDETMGWHYHAPDQQQSPMRAKPSDDSPTSSYAKACIEVHSHVDMHAVFSSVDDQDELGFRIYAVLGSISTRPVIRVRVGMYGYRHDIPANWVFDLPPGIGDAVTGEGTLLGPVR
jgi:hypothetical protein